jgi:hypothetical protein
LATLKMIAPIKNRRHLLSSVKYIMQEEKTGNGRYISGVNLFPMYPQDVIDSFYFTKKSWEKETGRLAYHWEQSFKPGEVSPAEAHQIGMEFAEKVFGDFEVVVATHIDKKHIHNHFLFNSVSCVNGLKYHEPDSLYYEYRKINDAICISHGLSTVPEQQNTRRRYLSYPEKNPASKNKTVRDFIYEDFDTAIQKAKSTDDFYRILRVEMGYRIKRGDNIMHTAVSPAGHKNYFRLYKFKDGYTETDIEKRIAEKILRRDEERIFRYRPSAQKKPDAQLINFSFYFLRRWDRKQLWSSFLMYRFILRTMQARRYPVYVPFETRRQIAQLDKINQATALLIRNKLDTTEQVKAYMDERKEKVSSLYSKINRLNRELRKTQYAAHPELRSEIKEEIAETRKEISKNNREKKLCESILERAGEITTVIETHKDRSYDFLSEKYQQDMERKQEQEEELEL